MLTIERAINPSYYFVGTGETGTCVKGRIRAGRVTYCPMHGMKIAKQGVNEFVDALFTFAGIPATVKRPLVMLHPNGRKRLLGQYLIKSNIVILHKHTLGILLHELAHSVACQMFRDYGHKQGFKASLGMLHVAASALLKLNMNAESSILKAMLQLHCRVVS